MIGKKGIGEGSISVLVIIGILIIIFIVISTQSISNNILTGLQTDQTNSLNIFSSKSDIEGFLGNCIIDSVVETLPDTGIREATKQEMEEGIKNKLGICSDELFAELERQGFEIEHDLQKVAIEINDDTLAISIDFPIRLEKGRNTIEFDSFKKTFDRINYETISQSSRTFIISNDERSSLVIEPDTEVMPDSRRLGLKIEDKYFDGLENEIVVGNLVYSALDSGVSFNMPVQIGIQLRDQDIPPGVSRNQLSIAWWDEEFKIWRAMPTRIEKDFLYTDTLHFTKFAIVRDCAPADLQYYEIVDSGSLFTQRYEPCSQTYWEFSTEGSIRAVDVVYSVSSAENVVYGNGAPECQSGTIDVTSAAYYDVCDEDVDGGSSGECAGKTTGDDCGTGSGWVCAIKSIGPNTCECTDNIYRKLSPGQLPGGVIIETIAGYPNSGCVGGTVTDGNGDGTIFSVNFLPKGNACIREWSYATTCMEDDKCSVPSNALKEVATGDNMKIQVSSLSVINSNGDACASGGVRFFIQGTGVQ
ncbi:hypothetical protein JXC34_00785 [Candidatus Woesearchaeota archaeon]|nr:hypothetical protein [Candidatus Woesearchaeota archaeon]